MDGKEDFTLPKLSTRLRIFAGAPDSQSGSPTSVLYDPLANAYFKLGWVESVCLARFSVSSTATDLQNKIREEAGLYVALDDIKNLSIFLVKNGLSDHVPQGALTIEVEQGLWKTLLHKYLYFTIPLFHPQETLNKIYPLMAPFFSQAATKIILGMLAVMGFLTLARADEFLATYPDLFSLSGLIQIAIVYAVIKVAHEWAHALTATKYGVPVPHMGVAFIVLYPVLYTETSGAWRLSDKKQRAAIGLAGIRAELAIAVLALLAWNIAPAGSGVQSLSFLVVTVSLLSSLLINLNPLMRFDGYYILSDYLGIENMQYRACNFARWKLRETLFALDEDEPEQQNEETKHILTLFGFALLIYRFFLFTGIAVLVYHMFFKPLGLFLFCVEIWYFVLKPILSELKIWKVKWPKIRAQRRARLVGSAVAVIFVLLALPLYGTVSAPAIAGYKDNLEIHAPYASEIKEIPVAEGDEVRAGDVLAILKSPELEKNLELARQNLDRLESSKRRAISSPDQVGEIITDEQIAVARRKVEVIEEQKDHLIIIAPFAGKILEVALGLGPEHTVKATDKLMRLVGKGKDQIYTAYITESDIPYIGIGDKASFLPEMSPFGAVPLKVSYIEKINSSDLDVLELLSSFGGDIAGHHGKDGKFSPARGLYKVGLTAEKKVDSNFKIRGIVWIEGEGRSPIFGALQRITGFVMRELSWN